jgi:signal transduction histidine kinase
MFAINATRLRQVLFIDRAQHTWRRHAIGVDATRIRSHGSRDARVAHDNGADIPVEMRSKVFDKLATDPDMEGTGLGLAIVKQIVKAHGGTVSAESVHGAGATFSFTILQARER